MSSRLHASRKALDIGGTVFLVGEKVERRPIVPDVVSFTGSQAVASATSQ